MPALKTLSATLFLSLACSLLQAADTKQLTAEYILKQELSLNQLIVNIHLLQMDFQSDDAREQLQVQLTILDNEIPRFPEQSQDSEIDGLLASTLSLWPVISHHTTWMANLPHHSEAPEALTLLSALGKLDRKLLLLRQKLMATQPQKNNRLEFLEQALLMQRMTREYLMLSQQEKNQNNTASGRIQLKRLADHFSQKLQQLDQQLNSHAHAAVPMKKTQAAWNFIKSGIYQFPQQPVPELVARYNDKIVDRLTSIHQMF